MQNSDMNRYSMTLALKKIFYVDLRRPRYSRMKALPPIFLATPLGLPWLYSMLVLSMHIFMINYRKMEAIAAPV
jgi:hypothetical protein